MQQYNRKKGNIYLANCRFQIMIIMYVGLCVTPVVHETRHCSARFETIEAGSRCCPLLTTVQMTMKLVCL